jgi:hypothetical protein
MVRRLSIETSKKKPPKGRLRKAIELCLALGLIVGGALYMVAWEHSLAEVWADPSLIFWDGSAPALHAGRLWFVGPTLIAAGIFWIAEDWFNFR